MKSQGMTESYPGGEHECLNQIYFFVVKDHLSENHECVPALLVDIEIFEK